MAAKKKTVDRDARERDAGHKRALERIVSSGSCGITGRKLGDPPPMDPLDKALKALRDQAAPPDFEPPPPDDLDAAARLFLQLMEDGTLNRHWEAFRASVPDLGAVSRRARQLLKADGWIDVSEDILADMDAEDAARTSKGKR